MAGSRLPTLKNRRDFLRLQRGRRFAVRGLVLQAAPQPAPGERGTASHADSSPAGVAMAPLRLGFTVTKKVGNAVVRNRARRRLRAAADRVMPGTGRAGWDYVLIGRAETLTRPFERLCEDLERAVAAVHEGRGQRRGSGGGARKGDTRKNKKDATGKKSGKGDERGGARRPSAGKAR